MANHSKGGIVILYYIQNEIEMLESALVHLDEELEILPHGSLRCTSSNGTDQFFINGDYVSKKQIRRVTEIVQRQYDEKLKIVIKERLEILKKLEYSYTSRELENCFEKLCKARQKLIQPFFKTVEEKIHSFLEEEYEPGKFDEDNITEFITLKGERVRSKSELLISDHLNRYEVPYRYEKPIELQDRHKTVICRPDFTVMNRRTGKIFLHVHLGRMDDEDYVSSNMRKLELYEKNGYLLGENLIVTHETSKAPLNVKVLDMYIKTYFI